MLPRYNRLAKKKEIDLVFKKGRSSYNKSLGVKCLINNNLTYNRFAVVVSNKVSKKAVIRNKIKRRLMEVLGRNLEKFGEGRRRGGSGGGRKNQYFLKQNSNHRK